eukprot:TRINITY_DN50643_c0_g1_i1.p1 TRINITY_DN50643_c0_g1~~TRINITY_DN50643_c0_g1_i1.p1  ORF type:complete len:334 (+),score=41.21 TRINITY_DN50643_c0_g1_i1:73-1074(+)
MNAGDSYCDAYVGISDISGCEVARFEVKLTWTVDQLSEHLSQCGEPRICKLIYGGSELQMTSTLQGTEFMAGENSVTAVFLTKRTLYRDGVTLDRLLGTEPAHSFARMKNNLRSSTYGVHELRASGFALAELKGHLESKSRPGESVLPILARAGFSVKELVQVGYTFPDFKQVGFTIADCKSFGFTIREMVAAGFSPRDFLDAGYSVADLTDVRFSARSLKQAGKSASEMREIGFLASQLKIAGYTLIEVKEGGYTLAELKEAGYALWVLAKGGFGMAELLEVGFSQEEFLAAGIRIEGQHKRCEGAHMHKVTAPRRLILPDVSGHATCLKAR